MEGWKTDNAYGVSGGSETDNAYGVSGGSKFSWQSLMSPELFAVMFLLVLLYFWFWHLPALYQRINNLYDKTKKQQEQIDELSQSSQISQPAQPVQPPPSPPSPPPPTPAEREYYGARERLIDPLVPPVRGGTVSNFLPFNIPTQGEYGPFEQVGYLVSTDDKNKVSVLMGRRIHSRQHEYYTFHPGNDKIKIPINIPGNRELMDEEKIQVDGFGEAQVHIYEHGTPRYIPY